MLKKPQTLQEPLDAIQLSTEPAVLAVIAGVEGPSYGPVGAIMAVFSETHRVGTLSSGCIESDISLHALDVEKSGEPRVLRYGKGSPFVDIQLPCGGGLDIALLPNPDPDIVSEAISKRDARERFSLQFDLVIGTLGLAPATPTILDGSHLSVLFEPEIRFLVFGKGPEASTFAGLVQSAGYSNLLISPDAETLANGEAVGCQTLHMTSHEFPANLDVDDRTAIILFFHDHDWEPPILSKALDTEAFYIGAQRSQRARDARHLSLESLGVDKSVLSRLHGPVGLIPSARDSKTLAVSVLAEILKKGMHDVI